MAQHFPPSAMIDLSDGLASDLQRLAEQSKVGFEIWSDSLPISKALRGQKLSRTKEIRHAMQDGEDYELLFTISPEYFQPLQRSWKKHFKLPLTAIGIVRSHPFGIQLVKSLENQSLIHLPQAENDHFK